MFVAHRSGSADWLIPVSWRGQFEAAGYRMREPPAGLPEVSVPVLLEDIQSPGAGVLPAPVLVPRARAPVPGEPVSDTVPQAAGPKATDCRRRRAK